ncbi:hypothetical protein JMM81_20745 [Bacillus sp. V3B]|nr:hypothetical protein [Bacillus sp. V3B]
MNGVQVVAKQEKYRERTIDLVESLMSQGLSKDGIAEEVGISGYEVASVQKIVGRRLKEANGKKIKYQTNERRFF